MTSAEKGDGLILGTCNTYKPGESALRFSDCPDICLIVEGADNCLHCYSAVEAGHSRHFPIILSKINLFVYTYRFCRGGKNINNFCGRHI